MAVTCGNIDGGGCPIGVAQSVASDFPGPVTAVELASAISRLETDFARGFSGGALPDSYVDERGLVQSAYDELTRVSGQGLLDGGSLGGGVMRLHVMSVAKRALDFGPTGGVPAVRFLLADVGADVGDGRVSSFRMPRVMAMHFWVLSRYVGRHAAMEAGTVYNAVTRALAGPAVEGKTFRSVLVPGGAAMYSVVPTPYVMGTLDHIVACTMDLESRRHSPMWESGYCYLALVPPQKRAAASFALRSWPLLADLMGWLGEFSCAGEPCVVVYAVGPGRLHVAPADWAPKLGPGSFRALMEVKFGSDFNRWRIGGFLELPQVQGEHSGNLRRGHLGDVRRLGSHLSLHRGCCLRYPTEFGFPQVSGGFSYLLSIRVDYRLAVGIVLGAEPKLTDYVAWLLEHRWAFSRKCRMVLVDDGVVCFRSDEDVDGGYKGIREMLWRLLVEFDWPKRSYSVL